MRMGDVFLKGGLSGYVVRLYRYQSQINNGHVWLGSGYVWLGMVRSQKKPNFDSSNLTRGGYVLQLLYNCRVTVFSIVYIPNHLTTFSPFTYPHTISRGGLT